MDKASDKLRRVYEKGEITVETLCKQFGVSSSKLYRLANEENWTKRSQPGPMRKNAAQLDSTDDQKWRGNGQKNSERAFLLRLKEIAHKHIETLESELEPPATELSPSERERNVRSLRNVLKIIEEIVVLENKLDSDLSNGEKPAFNDKIRLELAKRITELQSKR